MRVAVTGAAGMVGGQVVRESLASGHDVLALCRSRPRAALPGVDVEKARVSLDEPAELSSRLAGVEALVHCAAVYAFGADRAAEVQRVNVEGTRTVLQAAASAGVRRVVVTSSSVTCGSSGRTVARSERDTLGHEPAPAYYHSKVAQERAALQAGHALGLEVVIALPTVVLGGPWTRLAPSNAIVLRYLLDPLRTTYPGGCNVVEAAAVGSGHVVLLERGEPGRRYLLGGEDVTWRTLHTLVAQLAGLPGPLAESTAATTWAASAAAEGWARLTGTAPLATREEARTVGRYYWYSSSEAASLGYRGSHAREAVASSLAWLMASGKVPRWVREQLRLSGEVHRARRLVPRPLP